MNIVTNLSDCFLSFNQILYKCTHMKIYNYILYWHSLVFRCFIIFWNMAWAYNADYMMHYESIMKASLADVTTFLIYWSFLSLWFCVHLIFQGPDFAIRMADARWISGGWKNAFRDVTDGTGFHSKLRQSNKENNCIYWYHWYQTKKNI